MFFKLTSLSIIAIFLVVSYLNIDTHESPVLLPLKNEVKKETDQSSLQINEPMIVKKDECESYIATPTGKICLQPRIHNDDKKGTETKPTSLSAPVDDFSIPGYLSKSEEDIPSSTGKDVEAVVPITNETTKADPELVLISPF